jgi:hypothetical protein
MTKWKRRCKVLENEVNATLQNEMNIPDLIDLNEDHENAFRALQSTSDLMIEKPMMTTKVQSLTPDGL